MLLGRPTSEVTRLAGHRSARFVAEWLAEHGGPDADPSMLDAATGGALTRLATLTASTRQLLLPDQRWILRLTTEIASDL
jgi:hypothetical protein